jgi:hypothetical protein
MIDLLPVLEQRRMALQERSNTQRNLIAEATAALAAKGVVLDRAIALARGIAMRPVVVGSVAALALAIGPRRLLAWAGRIVGFYGLTRQIAAALRSLPR